MSGQDKNSRIWDDIEAGRYKAAHKTCVRRIEKGETSDYLQVLRAHTLSLYASATLAAAGDSYATGRADFAEASKLAKRLASRPVPFTDVDALRLLSRVCDAQKLDAVLISGALERAAKAKPKDLKLGVEWFNGCVRAGNWRGAQAAAMVLQKTWTNREFFFWAAASSWLLARSHAENTPERNLFGTLAYKMVMKARNDTPMDTKVLPARAIQTVQEVHLLVAIVRDYGTDKIAAAKEALNILESKNLGVDSEIGKGDWWGLVRLRLDVLEDLSEWTKEREVCKELLAGSVEGVKEGEKTGKGDDWRVWEGLLKATEAQLKAGGSKEYADKLLVDTKQVIENHMKVDKKSRNVLLAGCYYAGLVDSKDKAKRESEAPELLEKVEKYFEQWGTKNCCFEDIRLYTEQLNEKAQAAFLKFVAEKVKKLKADANDVKSKVSAAAAETNQLKFEYLLTLSTTIPVPRSPSGVVTLEAFAEKCLVLYQDALSLGSGLLETDDQHGDDAGLLAVMALVRAYSTSHGTTPEHLYKALIQLDTMLEKSPHNYQVMLFAISVSIMVGNPLRALAYVPDLSIKQVQLDTLTHFYLTRISSLLPYCLDRVNFETDATKHLARLEKFYRKAVASAGDMQISALEKGTYSHCAGFVDFHRKLKTSLNWLLTTNEHRRIDRYRRAPRGTQGPFEPHVDATDPAQFPVEPSDNRDFKVIANWEHSSLPSFYEYLLTISPQAPAPSPQHARAYSAIENLFDALHGPAPPSVPNAIPMTIGHTIDDFPSHFTPAELENLDLAVHVALAAQTQSRDDLAALEAAINKLRPTKSGSLGYQLHERNEYLHALTLAKFLTLNFESSAKLRKRVQGINAALSEAVREIKAWEQTNLGGFEGVVKGKIIERWGDDERLVESTVEGVESERRLCWTAGEVCWNWVEPAKKKVVRVDGA